MKRPTSHHLPALALITLAVSVALTGCGGGETTALATSSMSKAEFVKRVEAICAQARSEAIRYRPAGKGESQPEALAKAIEDTLLPAIGKAVDDLYALGAPAAEKEQTEAFLSALRQGVEEGEGLSTPALEKVEELLAPSGRLARRAGFLSCVYG